MNRRGTLAAKMARLLSLAVLTLAAILLQPCLTVRDQPAAPVGAVAMAAMANMKDCPQPVSCPRECSPLCQAILPTAPLTVALIRQAPMRHAGRTAGLLAGRTIEPATPPPRG